MLRLMFIALFDNILTKASPIKFLFLFKKK